MLFEAMKALYGCVQSAKLWYNKLTSVLKKLGFVANEVDPCVLNAHRDGHTITVVIFVDDILVMSLMIESIEWLVDQMRSNFKKVTAQVDVKDFSYLGMRVRIISGAAVLTMDGFETEMLGGYQNLRECITPAKSDLFSVGESDALAGPDREMFHTMVAKLLYYALRVKPEIQTAVSYLTTRVREPNQSDSTKLLRVMGYVKRTRGVGMTLRTDGATQLRMYVDVAFACHDDAKSHTGVAVMLGRACVYARSIKQKLVTMNSTEAEIAGASDEVKKGLCADEFLREQGINMDVPTLMQDNESAIDMMTTGSGKDRSKHLRMRKHAIKQLLDHGVMTITSVRSGVMFADLMAKPSQGSQFRGLTQAVNNNDTEG